MAQKAENQTSGNAEDIKSPAERSPTEVKAEENALKKEAEAESLSQIADISAEINAEIKKGAEAEKKQQKIDEANDNFFIDEIIEESAERKFPLVQTLAFLGLGIGAFFIIKNRLKKEPATNIEEELNNGKKEEVKINNFGMME